MTRLSTLAALTLTLAAGAAFADDITIDPVVHTSSKTRAEVAQDFAQFRKGPNPWSTSYNVAAVSKSVASRDEVKAEVAAARRSGTLNAMTAEDSGSAYLAQTRSKGAPSQILAAR